MQHLQTFRILQTQQRTRAADLAIVNDRLSVTADYSPLH